MISEIPPVLSSTRCRNYGYVRWLLFPSSFSNKRHGTNNGHMVLTSTSFSLMKKKQLIFKRFIFKLFKVFASKNLNRLLWWDQALPVIRELKSWLGLRKFPMEKQARRMGTQWTWAIHLPRARTTLPNIFTPQKDYDLADADGAYGALLASQWLQLERDSLLIGSSLFSQVSSLFSIFCFRKSTPSPTTVHLLSITEQLPFYEGLHFCSSKKGGRLKTLPTWPLPLQSEGGHTLLWSQGGGRLCDWQDCLNLSCKLLLSFPEKRRSPKVTPHHTRPLTGRTQVNSPPYPTLVCVLKGLKSMPNFSQARHIKPLIQTLCTMLLWVLQTF